MYKGTHARRLAIAWYPLRPGAAWPRAIGSRCRPRDAKFKGFRAGATGDEEYRLSSLRSPVRMAALLPDSANAGHRRGGRLWGILTHTQRRQPPAAERR